MGNKLSKIVSWILYLLVGVSALLTILFYFNALSVAAYIQWGVILLIVAAVVAIISPIYGFILNPGNIVNMLLSVGLVVVIGILSYVFAGNTFSDMRLETLGITAQTSKLVGMGMLFTYIVAAISIVTIIASSIIKFFK